MELNVTDDVKALLIEIFGEYVDNPQVLFEEGKFVIPEDEAVEFLTALAPIMKDAGRLDPLLNSTAVRNGIYFIAGVTPDANAQPFSFPKMIQNFLVRCMRHKLRMKALAK